MMEGCSLNPCNPSDVPQCVAQLEEEEETCGASSEQALSSVSELDPFGAGSATAQVTHDGGWTPDDVWMVDDEVAREGGGGEFVDLLANPERFTGYKGFSSRSIWAAIYNENCFNDDDDDDDASDDGAGTLDAAAAPPEMCMEKRVFFRLISGLHASITCHLVGTYFHEDTGEWGPNYAMYKARFGSNPEHLENLYFAYMLALRALDKAAPLLEAYPYRTDNATEEAETVETVIALTSSLHQTLAATCPVTFDETQMFKGPDAASLRAEFQAHFYNISRIMDCVECSKCRLWGKIQIRGLSTALRILFGDQKQVEQLTRNKVLTLVWTLYRLSESIAIVNDMRSYELYETLAVYAIYGAGAIIAIAGVYTALKIATMMMLAEELERKKKSA